MSKAIKVENLSKAYQIGEFSTGTLSRDLERWWALSRGKEDPFLKIGETNVRSSKGKSNVVWSLKDLNFEVKQGEALGIIGKNGAGKSTLLKLLSQITTPTTGLIKMKGRVASLLEVGTGFHPELTGRENIYLNGAILGMQKSEVRKHFDEIVDFSGIDRYVDTPVKRYSSGMYVRLAFAVAAHLDSEILIVDEVLAVGDAEFQNKCIGKMGQISNTQGRTILFVSHTLSLIQSLCKNTILLNDGTIKSIGKTENVIEEYLSVGKTESYGSSSDNTSSESGKKLKIRNVSVLNEIKEIVSEVINTSKDAYIEINYEIIEEGRNYNVSFELYHMQYGCIFTSSLNDEDYAYYSKNIHKKGVYRYLIKLPLNIMRGGEYKIVVSSAIPKVEILDEFKYDTFFSLIDLSSPVAISGEGRRGFIMTKIQWLKQ